MARRRHVLPPCTLTPTSLPPLVNRAPAVATAVHSTAICAGARISCLVDVISNTLPLAAAAALAAGFTQKVNQALRAQVYEGGHHFVPPPPTHTSPYIITLIVSIPSVVQGVGVLAWQCHETAGWQHLQCSALTGCPSTGGASVQCCPSTGAVFTVQCAGPADCPSTGSVLSVQDLQCSGPADCPSTGSVLSVQDLQCSGPADCPSTGSVLSVQDLQCSGPADCPSTGAVFCCTKTQGRATQIKSTCEQAEHYCWLSGPTTSAVHPVHVQISNTCMHIVNSSKPELTCSNLWTESR
eukprot:1161803-Pelagomonas_calceolata.AAC.20